MEKTLFPPPLKIRVMADDVEKAKKEKKTSLEETYTLPGQKEKIETLEKKISFLEIEKKTIQENKKRLEKEKKERERKKLKRKTIKNPMNFFMRIL